MKEKKLPLKERLRMENEEYLYWEEEHERLEREIRTLNRKGILTPEEEIYRKRLQKEKLFAKDRMAEILRREMSKK